MWESQASSLGPGFDSRCTYAQIKIWPSRQNPTFCRQNAPTFCRCASYPTKLSGKIPYTFRSEYAIKWDGAHGSDNLSCWFLMAFIWRPERKQIFILTPMVTGVGSLATYRLISIAIGLRWQNENRSCCILNKKNNCILIKNKFQRSMPLNLHGHQNSTFLYGQNPGQNISI